MAIITFAYYEFVFVYMQVDAISGEPVGPWDGGDNINITIAFRHMVTLDLTRNFHNHDQNCWIILSLLKSNYSLLLGMLPMMW